MAHAQPAFANLDDRNDERVKVRTSVQADLGNGGAETCIVQDISTSGFLIETNAAPDASRILVHLPDETIVPATIVWTGERFLGCRFDHPLTQSVVDQLAERSPVVWPRFARRDQVVQSPAHVRATTAEHAAEPSGEDIVRLTTDHREEQRMSPRASMLVIAASAMLSWGIVAACVVPLI